MALCNKDRVFRKSSVFADAFVDALTGVTLSHKPSNRFVVDMSGALMWCNKDGTVIVSGGLNCAEKSLAIGSCEWHKVCFRYGVIFDITERQALRFDIDQ